jgi:uncharacterized protein YbcI
MRTSELPPGFSLLCHARGSIPQRRGRRATLSDDGGHSADPVADPLTSVLAAISREMVRIYKEQFGRGPTKVWTNFAGPDAVLCMLEDTFTPAEHKLAEMGEHQRLRDTRLYFQHATKVVFCSVIEQLLGRKVRGFVSGVDTEEDISDEVFFLESV